MSIVNRRAKATVLRVLRDPAIKKLNYGFSTRYIKAGVYEQVAKAIEKDQISIFCDPSLNGGVGGLYYPVVTVSPDEEYYDVLVLGFEDLGNGVDNVLTRAQIIVHECTHAAFDMLKLPLMQHVEHELGAYIAGALFAVAFLGQRKARPEKLTFNNAIKDAAWQIALRIYYEDRIPQHYFADLDRAISTHSVYRATAQKFANNDGVGRAHRLGPRPKPYRAPMAL